MSRIDDLNDARRRELLSGSKWTRAETTVNFILSNAHVAMELKSLINMRQYIDISVQRDLNEVIDLYMKSIEDEFRQAFGRPLFPQD
jgi:hypothetical protein